MGSLYVVATPIGNLDDITLRALNTLKEVDAILCEDTRCSLKLCNHFDIKKPLYAYHKFNEQEKKDWYISKLQNGENLALITDAGTPCISDPGFVLIREARKIGIPVIPIGGISAVVTALSVCGMDTRSFAFFGFFPREKKLQEEMIATLKMEKAACIVFYESPKRILKTLRFLEERFSDISLFVASDLTKFHERFYYGTIQEVNKEIAYNENVEKGEYTFVLENPYFTVKTGEENEDISFEAMLVDLCVKQQITLKEAVEFQKKLNPALKKKDLYDAMLRLKNLQ